MTLWFCRKTSYQYGCCRPEPLCYLATVEKMTHLVDRVPSHVPACCFLCVEVCRGFEQRSQVFFSSTGIGSNNAIKGYIARFHPKWKEWCTCMISLRDFLYIDALFGLISYNDPRWWFQFFFTCSSLIGQDVQFGSYVSR